MERAKGQLPHEHLHVLDLLEPVDGRLVVVGLPRESLRLLGQGLGHLRAKLGDLAIAMTPEITAIVFGWAAAAGQRTASWYERSTAIALETRTSADTQSDSVRTKIARALSRSWLRTSSLPAASVITPRDIWWSSRSSSRTGAANGMPCAASSPPTM